MCRTAQIIFAREKTGPKHFDRIKKGILMCQILRRVVSLTCSSSRTTSINIAMSSPPMEFPSSPPMELPSSELNDAEMQEAPPSDAQQAPPASDDNPLFLGTPTGTPMRNVAARRALGLTTPRRAPGSDAGRMSSPILNYPSSSSSARPSARAHGVPSSTGLQDSDPLHFPS